MSWVVEPSIEICANQCGAKCCTAPGYVYLSNDEARELKRLNRQIKLMRHDANTWVMDHAFNGGACKFLQENKCSIYQFRPKACRRFPSQPYEGCLVWPVTEK